MEEQKDLGSYSEGGTADAAQVPCANGEVATTRQEWEDAQHSLAALEAFGFYSGMGNKAAENAATVRKVLNRLPAASRPAIEDHLA